MSDDDGYMGEDVSFGEILSDIKAKAAAIPGPRTPIYLFEFADGYDMRDGKTAVPLTRIGGHAPGKPLPRGMKHAMSIDLREVPELAQRFPGAAVLSLIVPTKARGDDYQESFLRTLSLDEAIAAPGLGEDYYPLKLHRIEVPALVFNGYLLDMDESELEELDSPDPLEGQRQALNELYDSLYVHHGLLGNFNRLRDNPSEGPDEAFLFTLSDHWISESDGRLVVFGSPQKSAVVWHR